ncbi:MAG: GIY-YIG nuclease family protein [Candidatus Omnitrophica bacterium]|nr:GIY-YIG nuclease family protein [Candidatus Omnitrophota bacterium]MBD3269387.1 GIY-YIG nuclease family protein [Candidatus Omnitrophota bacterium]
MCYVYVLESLRNKKHYIRNTKLYPYERLKHFNTGNTKWARDNRPFELRYFETCLTASEARKRRSFFKTNNGRKELDILLGG